jgi:hypothetical protein
VEVFQVSDGEGIAAFTGEEGYVGEYACQIDAAVERLGGSLVCSDETGAKAARFLEGELEGVHFGGLGEYDADIMLFPGALCVAGLRRSGGRGGRAKGGLGVVFSQVCLDGWGGGEEGEEG